MIYQTEGRSWSLSIGRCCDQQNTSARIRCDSSVLWTNWRERLTHLVGWVLRSIVPVFFCSPLRRTTSVSENSDKWLPQVLTLHAVSSALCTCCWERWCSNLGYINVCSHRFFVFISLQVNAAITPWNWSWSRTDVLSTRTDVLSIRTDVLSSHDLTLLDTM